MFTTQLSKEEKEQILQTISVEKMPTYRLLNIFMILWIIVALGAGIYGFVVDFVVLGIVGILNAVFAVGQLIVIQKKEIKNLVRAYFFGVFIMIVNMILYLVFVFDWSDSYSYDYYYYYHGKYTLTSFIVVLTVYCFNVLTVGFFGGFFRALKREFNFARQNRITQNLIQQVQQQNNQQQQFNNGMNYQQQQQQQQQPQQFQQNGGYPTFNNTYQQPQQFNNQQQQQYQPQQFNNGFTNPQNNGQVVEGVKI